MKKIILSLLLVSLISILFCSVAYAQQRECIAQSDCLFDEMCLDGICQQTEWFTFEGRASTISFKTLTTHSVEIKVLWGTTPVIFSLNSGETKEADLNSDGTNDIRVTLDTGIGYTFEILTTQKTCTDSDGGKDYYVKGVTTVNGQSEADTCYGAGAFLVGVKEYYCDGNEIKSVTYDCPYADASGNACDNNGACVKKSSTTTSGCKDSDGGNNPLVKGTTTLEGYPTATDTCAGKDELDENGYGEMMVEYYCQGGVITQDPHVSCSAKYGSNYVCQDGACVKQTTTAGKKSIGELCNNDYECETNHCDIAMPLERGIRKCLPVPQEYTPPTTCNYNGRCNIGETDDCSDCKEGDGYIPCHESDEGLDIYNKGSTQSVYPPNTLHTDYCIDSNTLLEYECTTEGGGWWQAEEKVPCPSDYRCSDGACIPTGAPSQAEAPTEMFGGCDNGCLLDGTCVSFGFRKEGRYCDVDKQFYQQKQSGEACDNNFECLTNSCSKGACIDIEQTLKESIGLLKRIWCRLIHLFNSEAYGSCLAE